MPVPVGSCKVGFVKVPRQSEPEWDLAHQPGSPGGSGSLWRNGASLVQQTNPVPWVGTKEGAAVPVISTCHPMRLLQPFPQNCPFPSFLRKEDFLAMSPENESLYLFVLPHRKLSFLSGPWLHSQLSLVPHCRSRTQPSPSVPSTGMRPLDGKNASDIPDWSELLKDVATLGLVSWSAKSPSAAPEGSGTSGTSVWSNPGQLPALPSSGRNPRSLSLEVSVPTRGVCSWLGLLPTGNRNSLRQWLLFQESREVRNGCATIQDVWDITSGTL